MINLEKPSGIILKKCMAAKKGERILILIDRNNRRIGEALFKKAKEICDAVIKEIDVPCYDGQEPTADIAKLMLKQDVIVIATTKSLSHTIARKAACDAGARIASMPGITETVTKRAIDVDYDKIKKINEKICSVLKRSRKVRITTSKGTDLLLSISKKSIFSDDGLYHKKGKWGNLPAGEAGGAPIEGIAEGTVVIDQSMAGIGKLKRPIKLIIKKGNVVRFVGGKEAAKLRRLLESFKDKKVYNIAELGIGTNEKAKVSGNILEDEKVYGTAHIALGNNISYGGKIDAPCHLDGIFSKPTIFIDGKKRVKSGKIVL